MLAAVRAMPVIDPSRVRWTLPGKTAIQDGKQVFCAISVSLARGGMTILDPRVAAEHRRFAIPLAIRVPNSMDRSDSYSAQRFSQPLRHGRAG
jgi:hypothetical protein